MNNLTLNVLKGSILTRSDTKNLGMFEAIPEEIIKVIFKKLANNNLLEGLINFESTYYVCKTFNRVSKLVLRQINTDIVDLPQNNQIDSSWMDSYGL